MDFLKNLGFDPIALGAQIINFLIIFYLLKRFLYKPVMDMVNSRNDKIKLGIKQAEEAKLALENAVLEENKILVKARNQANEIVEEAKKQANEISEEASRQTKSQAERMILEAKQKIDDESRKTEEQLYSKTAFLASEILQKSLSGLFSKAQQKEITNKALKNIRDIN